MPTAKHYALCQTVSLLGNVRRYLGLSIERFCRIHFHWFHEPDSLTAQPEKFWSEQTAYVIITFNAVDLSCRLRTLTLRL